MENYYTSINQLLESLWPHEDINLPENNFLNRVRIKPGLLEHDAHKGITFRSSITFGQGLEFAVPNTDSIFISLGDDSTAYDLNCSIYPTPGFTIDSIPITIKIRSQVLVPAKKTANSNGIDVFTQDHNADHISLKIENARFGYTTDRGLLLFNRFTLSLPVFLIKGTDLFISLDDISIISSDAQFNPEVINLGFDIDFRGIYASSVTLHFLPEIQLNGHDVPGLRMDFEDLAIGNQGVSFDLALSWEVVHDANGVIDTDETELWGYLFNENWQIAIESANGSIRRNIPESFSLKTFLSVPFFKAIFSAYFGLSYRYEADGNSAYKTFLTIAKESASPIEISYFDDELSLSVSEFQAGGFLSDQAFEIEGHAAFDIDLFGFELSVGSSQIKYAHDESSDHFSFSLNEVGLGELGDVEQATLLLQAEYNDQNEFEFKKIQIAADYSWQDLQHLIPQQLKDVVSLPEDGRIEAQVSWVNEEQNGTATTRVIVDLKTEVSHLDNLWNFIPNAYKPQVRSVQSMFRLSYATADDFSASSSTNTSTVADVELSAMIEIKLPDIANMNLPGFNLIRLETGDEDGFITAVFKADYQTDQSDESFNAGLNIENPFSLDIALPGTDPASPFIHTSINRVGLQFQADDDQEELEIGGKLFAEGDFNFRPLAPLNFPFADQFNTLLHQVGLADITGRSSISIGFSEDSFDFEISGEFDNFGIEIDVFQMLSSLSLSDQQPTNGEIDIDFDMGFKLIGFSFKLGTSSDESDDGQYYFDFGLTVQCSMTGLPPVKAAIRLSNEEFSFGIEDLTIPLEIPEYPIDLDDLALLEDSNGIWQSDQLYSGQINNQIVVLGGQIAAEQNPATQFELIKEKARLELKKLMLEIIMAIHKNIHDDSHELFQTLVVGDTWVHSTVLSVLHVDTQIKLFFPEIKFKIPFDDPSGISIAGTGKLIGFNDDSPLKNLEDYKFSLGLSSQYIFAQIESDADPIRIPSFGSRYDDGSISISKFMIGYGYTKNSFALDFAGELIIPSELQNDADTSDLLGMGIRLPRYNKLAFKLDLIPVSIGKANFIIPLPQFDLDLRSPHAPALVSTEKCEPYWDGLELIIKNIYHVDLKHLAFSPFFGFSITPNFKYDGDLQIGDNKNGLTLIVDDLLLLVGTYTGTFITIPLFVDPAAPYFQNICCNLRALGFEINFNLQRPFPSASPIAAIEAFGLISDPMMKIDPKGELANSIRFTLTDAYLNVPDFVIQMFPDAANIVKQKYDYTLNLGTLISLTQAIYSSAQPLIEQAGNIINDSSAEIEDTLNALPNEFDPWSWIALLPAELRKFRVSGQLAGFKASACLVLATEQEAKASLQNKDQALPAPPELNLKHGESFIRYRKSANVLYQPTEGYDFSDNWRQAGVQGAEWIKTDTGITQSKSVNGISYFIYLKNIPQSICTALTIATAGINQWAGLVFNYRNPNDYYLLKTAIVQREDEPEHVREVVIDRKKSGHLSTILSTEIPGQPEKHIRLELNSYLDNQQRVFQINRIIESENHPDYISSLGRGHDRNPLGPGGIGFYAKNNPQAEFSNMQVYSLILRKSQFKQLDENSLHGNGFNVNLGHSGLNDSRLISKNESMGLFKGLEFKKFNQNNLSMIPIDLLENVNESDASIYIGAYVSVFTNQRLRFLGRLFQNGSFALISEAETKPFELSVFGLAVKIPFEGYGNLAIVGSQRNKGPWGFVQANGYFDWTPIAGVIRMQVGSKNKPASLKLFSDGNFSLTANGNILLFKGAGNISGSMFISHEMAQFEGKLYYALGEKFHDPDNYPFKRILELDIEGKGLIQVNNQFEFTGKGDIKFLGESFSNIEVTINQQYAAFEFQFSKAANKGATSLERKYPILRKCQIDLRARGRVNLRRTIRPEFEFTGDGSIGILGAEITGRGGIRAIPAKTGSLKNDFFETYIEGDLYWRNKKWLAGKISVGSDGLIINGSTNMGINITPAQIPGTQVNIASLFLNLNMNAEFQLDAQGANAELRLNGFWTLGLALADTGSDMNNQMLPLASSDFSFDSNLRLKEPLFKIDGFKFLPFDNSTFTLPDINITPTGETLLRFGEFDNDPRSGRNWQLGLELHLPSTNDKFRIDSNFPYLHPDDDKDWKDSSVEIKSGYDANFTTTELPLEFTNFSNLEISLELENSGNYPLNLVLEAPPSSGQPHVPKKITL